MQFYEGIYKAIIDVLQERKFGYGRFKKKIDVKSILFRYGKSIFIRLKHRHKQRIFNNAIQLLKADYIVRSVPEFRGVFELDVSSTLSKMVLNEGYEREIIPFFEAILSDGLHVVDIGANIGLYTVLAAKLVGNSGKVLAVEPVPSIFRLLFSNIKRNGLENVFIFDGVVASQNGDYNLNFVEGSPEYSSLAKIVHPHAPNNIKQITVPGETLDNLVRINGLNPSLVKIDVEGAEGLVLSGADVVLKTCRPIILSELDDRLLKELNWDSQKVISLLEKYNYNVFDAYNGLALSSKQLDRAFVGEIIALPKETETLA